MVVWRTGAKEVVVDCFFWAGGLLMTFWLAHRPRMLPWILPECTLVFPQHLVRREVCFSLHSLGVQPVDIMEAGWVLLEESSRHVLFFP